MFHLSFPAAREAPSLARHKVRRMLSEWRVSPNAIETAVLLTSELITNAVTFGSDSKAGSRGSEISLTLWRLPGLIIVEASDQNPIPPAMRSVDLDSTNGRGLMLVDALSKEWSCYFPRPGWKTVSCSIEAGES
jgi:anti-sigma regulatory factor (Ser/Thr protein kinase)